MIHYRKMSMAEAKSNIDEIDRLSDTAFDDLKAKWEKHLVDGFDESYSELRSKVLAAYTDAIEKGGYAIDLSVGFCLYTELNMDNGFTTVLANDNDIWRYISVKIFPDITYLRYPRLGKDDLRINKKRFYSHTRRIWLKTLWWYIHLSWQGDVKTTYKVLKDFGTDTISDFIERPGKGYRLVLFREIMKYYSTVNEKSAELFNKIAKQNLVNCRTIEPALAEEAEEGYVKELFMQLSISEEMG